MFEKALHPHRIYVEALQILFLLALVPLPVLIAAPWSNQVVLLTQLLPNN